MKNDSKFEYGSRFLYAEDLLVHGEFKSFTLTIAEVVPPGTIKAANGKMVDTPCLRFEKAEKMLVIGATNRAMVCLTTGEQLCDAAGKSVRLEVREVSAFGDEVLAIRIMPREGQKVRRSIAQRLGKPAVFHAPKEAMKPAKEESQPVTKENNDDATN